MKNALSHLKHDELCTVVLTNAQRREVRWDAERRVFFFTDTGRRCEQVDIEEWIPACRF